MIPKESGKFQKYPWYLLGTVPWSPRIFRAGGVGVYRWRKPEDPQLSSDWESRIVAWWAGSGPFWPSINVPSSFCHPRMMSTAVPCCSAFLVPCFTWSGVGRVGGIRSMFQISTLSHCSSSLDIQPYNNTPTLAGSLGSRSGSPVEGKLSAKTFMSLCGVSFLAPIMVTLIFSQHLLCL